MQRYLRPYFAILLFMFFGAFFVATAQEDSYQIPPAPEGVDLGQVVARVGDEEITLEELRARIRYERLYYYFVLERLVGDYGPEILQADNPGNQFASFMQNVVRVLVNDRDFGRPIYETMILERLYHQEAAARGIEVTECEVNEYWALLLNMQEEVVDCQMPEGFEETREDFIRRAELYTGLSEEDIQLALVSRVEFDAVVEQLGEEVEVPDVPAVRTRHIRVPDEETANELIERLQAGEPFEELLVGYTLDTGIQGNDGELGYFQREMLVPEFADAAFSSEVGEIVGPVRTQFGYHVIQVLDRQPAVRASHILFNNEADANRALELLEDGASFEQLAQTFSLDSATAGRGGDLGLIGRGQTQFGADFENAVFSADVGGVVGPIQSLFGYHLVQVTEVGEEVGAVNARHILLETSEEAEAAIERLNAGEDFAALARELSIDPSAAGHGGDTLAILSRGQSRGFYVAGETLAALEAEVFEAEPGDILGPIFLQNGYLVIEVVEREMRQPPASRTEIQRHEYAFRWQEEQLASDRIERTSNWYRYIPHDPMPSEVSEVLAPLDAELALARVAYEELQAQTTIVNVLRSLVVPEYLLPIAGEPPLDDVGEVEDADDDEAPVDDQESIEDESSADEVSEDEDE